MTAKAIAKRIKAKGLGRLRWYCQMCEKQCRDENGFQCHIASASHQRQLSLFAEAPKQFIDRFSTEFLVSFLAVVKQRYGTSAVHANTAYQEYIKDRHHLHMNATRWTTLSEFVKELGRSAMCKVEERDDGWWVTLIDRDVTERSQRAREMDRARLEEEERQEKILQRQLRNVPERSSFVDTFAGEEGTPAALDKRVSVSVQMINKRPRKTAPERKDVFAELSAQKKESVTGKPGRKARRSRWGPQQSRNALDEIMVLGRAAEETNSPIPEASAVKQETFPAHSKDESIDTVLKSSLEPEAGWVMKGIVVKVLNKELDRGKYYKQKGEILEVIDGFGAHLRLLESGAELQLDQDDLETVIPKPGGTVLVLEGVYRGHRATILAINEDSYSSTIRLQESGEIIENVEYEAVSRCI